MKLNESDKEELNKFTYDEALRHTMTRVMNGLAQPETTRVLTCSIEEDRELLIARAKYDAVKDYLKRFEDFIREHRRQAN
jgi:hypothetical protein